MSIAGLTSLCRFARVFPKHPILRFSDTKSNKMSWNFSKALKMQGFYRHVATIESKENEKTKEFMKDVDRDLKNANQSDIPVVTSDFNDASVVDADFEYQSVSKTMRNPFWSIEKDVAQNNASEMDHFIDDIVPPTPVSFNLAAFINKSPTLKKLVELNVDLAKIEEDPESAKFYLNLDFDRHVKPYIQFLTDNGVPADELGTILTKNPFLLKADLENLQIRLNYLQSKKFNAAAIARIITKCPIFLAWDTKSVDRRLGFLQKQFDLDGDEVRFLVTKYPKIVVYQFEKLLEKIFVFKEEMGFSDEEMKKLLLMKPKVWLLGRRNLSARFDVVHNKMGISHEQILTYPGILLKRTFLLDQRHKYLVHLGRAQYNPGKPCYIPLIDIATTTDNAFCIKCAKTSVEEYNEFLKSI